MNRRTALAATLAAMTTRSTLAASNNSDTLRQLIDEVIADGNLANLDMLVSPDVSIAADGVYGIDEFRHASVQGFASRMETYAEITFIVVSVAEQGEWAHALVRYAGERHSGRMEKGYAFYAAMFTDGLISHLYLS